MKYLLILIIAAMFYTANAQSRRASVTSPQGETRTSKELFDEANAYRKQKYEEFEKKKVRVSERLQLQTEREQKQLAAKYAAAVASRDGVGVEETYYLALLYWISGNLDSASDSLTSYLSNPKRSEEHSQTARSLLTVVLAKLGKTDDAVLALSEYERNDPKKPSERLRMNSELAKAYLSAGDPVRASQFAKESFEISRSLAADPSMRSVGIDLFYDNAMVLFDCYRLSGGVEAAERTLEAFRKTAASFGNSIFFFYGADKLITYRIETGRKKLALATYPEMLIAAGKELPLEGQQQDAIQRLKRREKHYRLLGEAAPELSDVDKWMPEKPLSIADLKGKVILLDFWATWCAPCFEAFPHLIEWDRDLSDEGLVILGITRYYGRAEGLPADEKLEFAYLQRFKSEQKLPYRFVVGKDQTNQILYGASALPTAVLIDRKGVVRYIEAGTSSSRIAEMHDMILKLLAEK